MAWFTQTRKRHALASGSLALSYNHTDGSMELSLRADRATPSGQSTYFALHVTEAEMDRVETFRRQRDTGNAPAFVPEALETANSECEKDTRNLLSTAEQDRKALDMALTMLRAFMPRSEQATNATLAYISTVAAEAGAVR